MSQTKLIKILSQICVPQIKMNITNNSGMAGIHRCRQMVTTQFVVTGNDANYLAFSIHVNSVFNAFNFGVGFRIQPPGYDVLANAYNRYIVLNASVLVVPQGSNQNSVSESGHIWIDNTQNAAERADTLVAARAGSLPMGSFDHESAIGKPKMPGGLKGLKKVQNIPRNLVNSGAGATFGELGSSFVGADPTVLSTMSVFWSDQNGNVMTLGETLRMQCWIAFDVVYYDPSTSIIDS